MRHSVSRFLMCLAATLGAATPAFAGKITAELDRTEAGLDDTVILLVTVEGAREDDPVVPDVPGLVIQQQGYSQSMVFSNGHRTSELSITYAIRAQQTGTFTIPSIVTMLDDEKASTLPLTLKIVEGSGAQSGAGAGAQNQAEEQDPHQGNQGGQGQQGKGAGKGQDTGGVFVERECASTAPYVGEQVVCAIRIFHRGNLNGGQRPGVNSPDFRRFSVEGEGRYQRVVGGQRYAVIELKDIVIPTKAGKLTLPPFTLEARVLTWSKRGNPFNKLFDRLGGGAFNFDMNFTEEKQVTVKTEPTEFDVKALPDAGKPDGFQGVVGHYDLRASLSKATVTTGDTVTASVTLEGEGVLDTLAEPPLDLKEFGKLYPDKPEYKETVDGDNGVQSSKTFRLALVPSKVGTFQLPDVTVPVFDPKLGQYVVLKAELGKLTIEQGDGSEQPLVVGQSGIPEPGKNPVKALGEDLLGPHGLDTLSSKQTITRTLGYILFGVTGLPWLGAFLIFGLQARRKKQQQITPELRRSKAFKHFQASLRALSSQTDKQPGDAVTEAHKAFRRYIGDKADRHGEALAAKELDEQLTTLKTSASVRTQVTRIITQLERIEFGGRQVTAEEARALVADLEGVAEAMEAK